MFCCSHTVYSFAVVLSTQIKRSLLSGLTLLLL
uniref:Uncharacterized protein n=1 Tax=Anguilla anguilla TaxID=7936 RepID=A0A0E9VKJ8_ANGAN